MISGKPAIERQPGETSEKQPIVGEGKTGRLPAF
jgi:hypothetical protein